MHTNLNSVLPPEQIHKYFVLEGSKLYRKLASGTAALLTSKDGYKIVTLFDGVKIHGTSIAWCLIHGNWPLYPITQLGADPADFSPANLYPTRLKRLRYAEGRRGNLYTHPLSTRAHISSYACRKDWETLAKDFYLKDLGYVLKLESHQREMRAAHLAELATLKPELVPVPKAEHVKRSARPRAIPGREWHWHDEAWMDIPVACHVADDYRVRIKAVLAGAKAFIFNAEAQRVDAIMPDGSVWAG
jgi:hypothetical protein